MNIMVKNNKNVNPQFKSRGYTQNAEMINPKIAVSINDEGNGAAFQPFHMYYHLKVYFEMPATCCSAPLVGNDYLSVFKPLEFEYLLN